MTSSGTDAGGGRERRAPIVASSRMGLHSKEFREEVAAFEAGLAELDSRDRRMVRILVVQLAGHWIEKHGSSERTLIAEVALRGSTMRVDVYTDPPIEDQRFWEELVSRYLEDTVTPWALDRRRTSGVWFELARASD